MIHVAVLHLAEPSPEGKDEQVFASLDGESYIPINRVPETGDEEAIAALFEPEVREDGTRFIQMKWARRCFNLGPAWFGDWVKSVDQYEV